MELVLRRTDTLVREGMRRKKKLKNTRTICLTFGSRDFTVNCVCHQLSEGVKHCPRSQDPCLLFSPPPPFSDYLMSVFLKNNNYGDCCTDLLGKALSNTCERLRDRELIRKEEM